MYVKLDNLPQQLQHRLDGEFKAQSSVVIFLHEVQLKFLFDSELLWVVIQYRLVLATAAHSTH